MDFAESYKRNQRYKQAILELQQAVKIKPADYQAHYKLALLYRNQGMMEQAAQEFNEAMSLKPEESKIKD